MKLVTLLTFLGVAGFTFGETPPIVFKRVSDYDWIWDDRGTGSYKGITIWRPKAIESGYYILGDAGVPSTNSAKPAFSAILVKEMEAGALAPPVSFTEVWRDRGSGGAYDGRFLKLNPPSGYTCLGSAAIKSWYTLPSLDLYRCVKNQYVTTGAGTYTFLWNDRGSGCYAALTLYSNYPSGSDTYALDAFTFTAVGNYNTPSGSPALLNGQFVKNHQEVSFGADNFVFNVYETPDKDVIWTDRMTGAYKGISVWRSRGKTGTYSLGDIAYPATTQEPVRGFVVKALKEDALKAPVDFRQIYKDVGTGGQWDGAFYQPICPAGYRAIGHVAMRNHWEKPPTDSMRCVKAEYTTPGKWVFIWDDRGSGGYQACTVSEAAALNSDGQSVQAMWTVQSYSGMGATAYVLKSDVVNYMTGKPVSSYTIQNVVYHFDDRKIVANEPESISRTTLVNRGDSEQEAEREIEYEFAQEYSWGNSVGLEIGIETTVSAGVPFIANGEVTVSASTSMSQDWGGATSETTTDTIAVEISVQPRSSKIAEIVGNRYTMDLPYTATLITHYTDGTTGTRGEFQGVFRGVEVNDIRVIYHADVPLV